MMNIPNNKNITTISYTSNAVPLLVSHDDVPGIKEPVSIVKGCVFWRQRLWSNGHILPEYITVFLCVPTQEYTNNPKRIGVGSYANHLNTNGVYIHIIGTFSHADDPNKKLILPRYRVIWTSYSKYLQEFGWNYLCSVGKYESTSMENIRQKAYTAIKRHRGHFYLEDAVFKATIERDFCLIQKVIDYFVDVIFMEGFVATNLKPRLEEAINLYSDFLWKNLGDDDWENMVQHVTSAMELYFKEEYPPKLEEGCIDTFVTRLKTRFATAHDTIFNRK